jgi:hypothetical protein
MHHGIRHTLQEEQVSGRLQACTGHCPDLKAGLWEMQSAHVDNIKAGYLKKSLVFSFNGSHQMKYALLIQGHGLALCCMIPAIKQAVCVVEHKSHVRVAPGTDVGRSKTISMTGQDM